MHYLWHIEVAFSICELFFVSKGGPVEYVNHDENSRRWMNEFRSKSYAKPITFEAVEG
jgi:hypothetical protein